MKKSKAYKPELTIVQGGICISFDIPECNTKEEFTVYMSKATADALQAFEEVLR